MNHYGLVIDGQDLGFNHSSCQGVIGWLQEHGCEVEWTSITHLNLSRHRTDVNLVLIDADAFGVMTSRLLSEVRRSLPRASIIALSAAINPEIESSLLDLGADDVIDPQASCPTTRARLRAALRRSEPPPALEVEAPPSKTSGSGGSGVYFDHRKRRLYVEGSPVAVTSLEYRLLKYLYDRPGEVVTIETLLREVFDVPNKNVSGSAQLRVKVCKLRQKLGPVRDHLQTVRGHGLVFVPNPGE